MNKTQKIGVGFLAFGFAVILLAYIFTSDRTFALAALIGLMAVAFGGFQLLIAQPVSTEPVNKTRKAARRR